MVTSDAMEIGRMPRYWEQTSTNHTPISQNYVKLQDAPLHGNIPQMLCSYCTGIFIERYGSPLGSRVRGQGQSCISAIPVVSEVTSLLYFTFTFTLVHFCTSVGVSEAMIIIAANFCGV